MNIEKLILKYIPGNVYWKDREGRYLGCNDNQANILKLKSPEEIIGKKDAEFIKSKGHLKQIEKNDRLVISTGEERIFEEFAIDRHEKTALYISKKTPIRNEKGEIIGLVGMSIDITDFIGIKDYILMHVPGNVYWKDLEGRYMGCNLAFSKIAGLNIPGEISGKSDRDLFLASLGENIVNKLEKTDREVIEHSKTIFTEDVFINEKGKLTTYISHKIPLKNSNDLTIGVIGSSIDITENKLSEIAKAEFISNMSHDLRTPFSGVIGFSKLLYENETDESKKIQLGYILESGEQLLKLINEIIDIVRLDDREVNMEKVNIFELIGKIISVFRAEIEFKKIDMSTKIGHFSIITDQFRLSRILLNLIGNAIKFTPKGTIELEVKQENNKAIMIIKDTGVGIAAKNLKKIFDKFYKVEPSNKSAVYQGSGLGLYITKQFVEQIGGTIDVESALGKGSTFKLTLPH